MAQMTNIAKSVVKPRQVPVSITVLRWVLVFLSFVAWLVTLAGVGAVQHQCDQDKFCGTNFLSLQWFAMFYELVLLFAWLGLTVKDNLRSQAVMPFFTVITPILYVCASQLIIGGVNLDSRRSAAAAGFIMLSFINTAVIVWIAVDWQLTFKPLASQTHLPKQHQDMPVTKGMDIAVTNANHSNLAVSYQPGMAPQSQQFIAAGSANQQQPVLFTSVPLNGTVNTTNINGEALV